MLRYLLNSISAICVCLLCDV